MIAMIPSLLGALFASEANVSEFEEARPFLHGFLVATVPAFIVLFSCLVAALSLRSKRSKLVGYFMKNPAASYVVYTLPTTLTLCLYIVVFKGGLEVALGLSIALWIFLFMTSATLRNVTKNPMTADGTRRSDKTEENKQKPIP